MAKKRGLSKSQKECKKARHAQLKDKDLLSVRPYWKFINNQAQLEPCHEAYSGLVLRHDDPWWDTRFPPIDGDCQCRVMAVREAEYIGQIASSLRRLGRA